MASGHIDVFAHGGNPSFPIDIEEVAKAAACYKVLVEINNSSFTTSRPGSEKNCAALAEAVGRHDGLLTFGSDAHIADRVGDFAECLAFITAIGFPEKQVISYSGRSFLRFSARPKIKRMTCRNSSLSLPTKRNSDHQLVFTEIYFAD